MAPAMDIVDHVRASETVADLWEMALGYSSTFGLRAVTSLGIPEMLVESSAPMSMDEIAAKLPGSNVQKDHLLRLMNFLAAKKVFSKVVDEEGITRFKLTKFSELLTKSRMAGIVMLQGEVFTSGWHKMPEFILHGGKYPFERANGMSLWENAQSDPKLAKLFSEAMVAMSNVTLEAILASYRGFESIQGVLVDVGGAFGSDARKIATTYPQIRVLNLELPAIVEMAPQIPGVEHVGGDMFVSIPKADAILLKALLHDFDDEAALQILKNCNEALPEGGKVIIVDIILDHPEQGPFEKLNCVFDLVLFAATNGGLERTQKQWIQLLEKSGFCDVNFVSCKAAIQSVIEAKKRSQA